MLRLGGGASSSSESLGSVAGTETFLFRVVRGTALVELLSASFCCFFAGAFCSWALVFAVALVARRLGGMAGYMRGIGVLYGLGGILVDLLIPPTRFNGETH